MIKIHKWSCEKCVNKWYLKIDDSIETDLIKLGHFEEAVSMHVLIEEHEVIHKEKGDTVFKFG